MVYKNLKNIIFSKFKMNNLEKNKDINYWNPEWINESFYDEILDDNNQRYLLLPPLEAKQQKNSNKNSINDISILSKFSG